MQNKLKYDQTKDFVQNGRHLVRTSFFSVDSLLFPWSPTGLRGMTVKVSKNLAFQSRRARTGGGFFPNRSRNSFLAPSHLNVMAKDTIKTISQLVKLPYSIFVGVIEMK